MGELGFGINVVPRTVIVQSNGSTEATVEDAVITTHSPAIVDAAADVLIFETQPGALAQAQVRNLNPEVGELNAAGRVSLVGNGTMTILVRTPLGSRRVDVLVNRTVGGAGDTHARYVSGTLAGVASAGVDSAISSGTAADRLPMYIDLEGRVRNPDCWMYQLASGSCIDAERPNACFLGNSGGVAWGVQANHYKDGSDVFIDDVGNAAMLVVADRFRVGDTDLSVVRYNASLGTAFTPALLPPADLANHFGQLQYGVPALTTDGEKLALISDLYSLTTSSARFKPPEDNRRFEFYQPKIAGDSGSPFFLLVPLANGDYSHRLLYLGGLTFGGAGSGPDASSLLDLVIQGIEARGGNSSDFEIADLSNYPTHS
jgi:hypothetical protein